MTKLKIGGAALNQTPLDWEGNSRHIREAFDQAREEQLDLLCLPELCITGYGCEDLFLHPWVAERAKQALKELLEHTHGLATVIGLPIRIDEVTYNGLAFVVDGEVQGFYLKQRLPKEGVHYEPRWFEPWPTNRIISYEWDGQTVPLGHITLDWKGLRVGFEICEDAWRGTDRPGCYLNEKPDLFLNPSASHFAMLKEDYRKELVRASSEQLDTVYLYCNQLGNEAGKIIFDGDVMVAQKGKLLATAPRLSFKDVSLHAVSVDFEDPDGSEESLQDILDGANEEFPQAVSLGLFDYLRKSRSKGFVLSLSGGADSSTLAVLVAEMVRRGTQELGLSRFQEKLGFQDLSKADLMKRLLTTAYQGTVNSSTATFTSARNLAHSVGAVFLEWQIDEEVGSYTRKVEQALGRPLTWETDDITLQNIQARARSPIIWMIANERNALLLATSNRSEGAVGYATMDGDTSGSISPIAGVSKAFIREWLHYAETSLGYSGLKDVNALAPSAELRPGDQHQTDEQDLMPYDVLQLIEEMFIYKRQDPSTIRAEIHKKYPDEEVDLWVDRFFRLWTRNQWKRERLAPSFHLDAYSLDPRSWMRHPILSTVQTDRKNRR